jgi:hypothetical protein
LWGAVTFTANIVLWRGTNYFDSAAESKPLLHTWSLSIEEQFYMLLPALLFCIPKKHRTGALLMLFSLSLALCMFLVGVRPAAAFYLLPTRMWELLTGALGTLPIWSTLKHRLPQSVGLLGLGITVGLACVPVEAQHPHYSALVACLGTLAVIKAELVWLSSGPIAKFLGFFGDISYSLYLIHWPALALARQVMVELPLPRIVTAAVITCAVILSWFLFRFVEDPIRRLPRIAPRLFATCVCVASFLVFAPLMFKAHRLLADRDEWPQLRRFNVGLSDKCDSSGQFEPSTDCRTVAQPTMVLWGDSYAMHLAQALKDSGGEPGFVQATRSACGPVLKLAKFDDRLYTASWAASCLGFNDSVLSYLASRSSIDTVVMASEFDYYLEDSALYLTENGVTGSKRKVFERQLEYTIRRLRSIGKKVVIIGPPPWAEFNIGACLERRAKGLVRLGVPDDCVIQKAQTERRTLRVRELLDDVSRSANVNTLWLDPVLCDGARCRVEIGSVALYSDREHLTRRGSAALGPLYGLSRRVREAAF